MNYKKLVLGILMVSSLAAFGRGVGENLGEGGGLPLTGEGLQQGGKPVLINGSPIIYNCDYVVKEAASVQFKKENPDSSVSVSDVKIGKAEATVTIDSDRSDLPFEVKVPIKDKEGDQCKVDTKRKIEVINPDPS